MGRWVDPFLMDSSENCSCQGGKSSEQHLEQLGTVKLESEAYINEILSGGAAAYRREVT